MRAQVVEGQDVFGSIEIPPLITAHVVGKSAFEEGDNDLGAGSIARTSQRSVVAWERGAGAE
jgi:hypothetical protein